MQVIIIYYKLYNITFIDCNAKAGGGLFLTNNVMSTFHSLTFKSCQSSLGGSGIYLFKGDAIIFDNIACYQSTTNGTGGCLWLESSIGVVLVNSTFLQSSSMSSGGCLDLNSIETLVLINNHFRLCQSVFGGAISFNTVSLAVMRWNYITHSFASEGGGIHFDGNQDIDIKQLYMKNCYATNGGSIYANYDKHLRLSFSTIIDSHATEFGGGIYVQNSYASHFNVQLYNCSAGNSGGGISFHVNNTSPVLRESDIKNNFAKESGGGVYYKSKNINSVIAGSNITNNIARNGGGISYYTLNSGSLIGDKFAYKATKILESVHPFYVGYSEYKFAVTHGVGYMLTFDELTVLGDGDILYIFYESQEGKNFTNPYYFQYDIDSDLPGIDCPGLRVYGNQIYIYLISSTLHKNELYGFKAYLVPISKHSTLKTIIKNNM